MGEATWLASNDPAAMLEFLIGHNTNLAEGIGGGKPISDRKLRLFVCAVAWALRLGRDEIDAAEQTAESGVAIRSASLMQSIDARHSAVMYCYPATGSAFAKRQCPPEERAALLREIVGNPFRPVVLPLDVIGKCNYCNGKGWMANTSDSPIASPTWSCSCQNGQRPVACSWLTPTVHAIARKAYDERPGKTCERCRMGQLGPDGPACPDCHGTGHIEDGTLCPDTLGVLADALEDAGMEAEVECESCRAVRRAGATWHCPCCYGAGRLPNQLIAHFRSPGPHVRGCWALDLILNQE